MKRHRIVLLSFATALLATAYAHSQTVAPAAHGNTAHVPTDAPEKAIQLHMAKLADKFMAELPGDPYEALKFLVEELNRAEDRVTQNRIMRLDLKLVQSLPEGKLSTIEPVFAAEGKLVLQISMVRSLAKNPILALETLASLNGIVKNEAFQLTLEEPKKTYHPHDANTSPYRSRVVSHVLNKLGIRTVPRINGARPLIWAELKMNEHGGSRLAAKELAEIDLLDARSARDSFTSFELLKRIEQPLEVRQAILEIASARGVTIVPDLSAKKAWSAYTQARLESLQGSLDEKIEAEKKEARNKRAFVQDPQRQKRLQEAESLPSKLNDYVQANDRESVARLLETYIPLQTLEPVERVMWQDYIEAIRHPRTDKEGTTLLFRGTERINDGFRLSKDQKGNESKSGMYSTLLARNQGNYTRRLRSFMTMRTRFAVPHDHRAPVSFISPKITHLLYNHANNPSGSPYLSFTREPRIATMWADSALVAVQIDNRRVVGNVMSPYVNEVEILVPLLVFPEEIVVAKQPPPGERMTSTLHEEYFREIEARTGKRVSMSSMNAYGMHQADFAKTFRDFGQAHAQVRKAGMCSGLFR